MKFRVGKAVLCFTLTSLHCLSAFPVQAQQYDLVIKGGHLIDPKNQINAMMDVAIAGGKIARVATEIPSVQAKQVVSATGLYVTPGLLDIHTHVFYGTQLDSDYSGGYSSLPPDGFTFRSGVTTVVDAGGSGVKTAHYEGPEWDPVDRAVEAGKLANVPIMVDFGHFVPERPFQELVLKHLRPGDIYTHMYLYRLPNHKLPMFDAEGKLLPYLWEARKRGVIFDVGHGGGSFLFRQAIPAMKQGFPPDSISTDLHVGSMNAGMKDMLNVMSKFLNMDMPLPDVILRSTWNPAKEIKRPDLGNLSVGSAADLVVLSIRKGQFGFIDVDGGKMMGSQKLECELTVREGKVVWDLNGISHPEWEKMPIPTERPEPRHRF